VEISGSEPLTSSMPSALLQEVAVFYAFFAPFGSFELIFIQFHSGWCIVYRAVSSHYSGQKRITFFGVSRDTQIRIIKPPIGSFFGESNR
jgi:hypothetical protein